MKIGILGGGQLARMLALAGYPLGFQFCVLDPGEGVCAARLTDHIQADYQDEHALQQLADWADCITYEFENVPPEAVSFLSPKITVYPPPQALATARNRLHEKRLFNQLGIETAAYRSVQSLAELKSAIAAIGLPAVLKTCTLGYDGKGQFVIEQAEQVEQAWHSIGQVPAILEQMIAFDREVSIIAVRNPEGEMAYYALTQNEHRQGILRTSLPIARDPLQAQAEHYAQRLLEAMDYIGVLAVEFFQVGDQLLANEMAPRVHNSGHWTIEGAECSQFENHLRAIVGLPLGSTRLLGQTAMFNLIGHLPKDLPRLLSQPGVHYHAYDKEPRPGRKIGHITLREEDLYHFPRLYQEISRLVPE